MRTDNDQDAVVQAVGTLIIIALIAIVIYGLFRLPEWMGWAL